VASRIHQVTSVRAALAIGLLLVLAAAGAGLQNGSAAPSTKNYTTTIGGTPAAGATFTASITLKNEASSSQTLGAEDVVLPVGYTPVGGVTPSTPSGKTWNAVTIGSLSLSDGTHPVIQLRAKTNGDALNPGTSLTANVQVTVPCDLPTDTTWKTEAKQSNAFSGPPGNDFLSTVGTLNNSTHLYTLPTPTTSGSCSFRFVQSSSDLSAWVPSSGGYRAGVGFGVTVAAVDSAGGLRSSFTGSATVSGLSNGPNGSSPAYGANSPHVSFTGGIASFTVTAKKKEHAALTVTDDSDSTQNATSAAFDVWPGDPAALTISTVGNGVVNTAIDPAITVDVFDAFGNKEDCTTCTQASVSLQFGTDGGFDPAATPPGSPLSGAGPVTSVNGTATFDSVTVGRSGTGFTLKAVSGSIQSSASNTFTIFDGKCVGGDPYATCSASKNNTSIQVDYPTSTIDPTLLQLSSLGKSIPCGSGSSSAIGALVTFTPADKDTTNTTYDYRNPIQVTLRWNKSLVPGTGVANFTLCLTKPGDSTWGSGRVVQDCPAKLKANTVLPCASKRSRDNAGDLVIILKLGSGDPIAGLH
jgi:hypothetical protein